jgi:hypothetical protein
VIFECAIPNSTGNNSHKSHTGCQFNVCLRSSGARATGLFKQLEQLEASRSGPYDPVTSSQSSCFGRHMNTKYVISFPLA